MALAIRTNTNSGESTVFLELWHLVHRNTEAALLKAPEPATAGRSVEQTLEMDAGSN